MTCFATQVQCICRKTTGLGNHSLVFQVNQKSERLIRSWKRVNCPCGSFVVSDESESLMVALLSWAMGAIHSRLLFFQEQLERITSESLKSLFYKGLWKVIAHSHSLNWAIFSKSAKSKWANERKSEWAKEQWANERKSEWAKEQNLNPAKLQAHLKKFFLTH